MQRGILLSGTLHVTIRACVFALEPEVDVSDVSLRIGPDRGHLATDETHPLVALLADPLVDPAQLQDPRHIRVLKIEQQTRHNLTR